MEWLENLQNAVNYIEDNILEDDNLTAENISRQIYSSEYHFRTIFRVITGYAIGEYIRNRRLSLAGEELLLNDISVLDLAVKYGYDTAESFTKAFTRFHGVSPSYVRKKREGVKTFTRIILKVEAEGGSVLNYSLEEPGEITLVGYSERFPESTLEENNQLIPEFVKRCCDEDFSGLQQLAKVGVFANAVLGYRHDVDGELCYTFGAANDEKVLEEKYDVVNIPDRRWLRFPCEGETEQAMQKLWYRIYTEFLPFSSYRIDECVTLEVSYCMNGENRKYLYLPVKTDKR